MRAFNFWNKFTVHSHKVIVAALFACSCLSVQGQGFRYARQNNPNYDERKLISYGFVIGLHSSSYQLKYSDKFVTTPFDTVHSVMTPWSPGFSLGFLVNLHPAEFLDLRAMPRAGFYDYIVEYNYTDGSSDEQLVETVLMEFPLLAKYKSVRRGNIRMYMLGGFTTGFEFSGKNDVQASSATLDIRRSNLMLDLGIGFDFYFPLFKYSQEIRFSKGLSDMLGNDPSPYKDPIKRLNTNVISVFFIFQ